MNPAYQYGLPNDQQYVAVPNGYGGFVMAPAQSQGHQSFQPIPSSQSLEVSVPCSLKRKAETMTSAPTPACDICHHTEPILIARECRHTFHSRCANAWPLTNCPVCQIPVKSIGITNVDMNYKPELRCGKWTKQEEDFVACVIDAFESGRFPLANGTPVRLLLARLLNCSPMRLSKKFQKNALGKRTYRVPKPGTSGTNSNTSSKSSTSSVGSNGSTSSMTTIIPGTEGAPADKGYRVYFSPEEHATLQMKISEMEASFRKHMVLLKKHDGTKDDGSQDLRNLVLAVQQFWVQSFIKFAIAIGQKINGIDTSEAKKRKLVLQRLRDGKYDQLFIWNNTPQRQMNYQTPIQASNFKPSAPLATFDAKALPAVDMWKPFNGSMDYAWKQDLQQWSDQRKAKKMRPAYRAPTTPLGTHLAKLGSFDESVFDLLGMDVDNSLDFDLLGAIDEQVPSTQPLPSNTNSWEGSLFDDFLGASSNEHALNAWSNITIE